MRTLADLHTALLMILPASVNAPAPALRTAPCTAEVRPPRFLLFFFAGWCSTCLPEARALDRLEREMGGQGVGGCVDVDPSDDAQTLQRFLRSAGDTRYTVVHDKDGALVRAFRCHRSGRHRHHRRRGSVVYRDAAPTRQGQLRSALTEAGVR